MVTQLPLPLDPWPQRLTRESDQLADRWPLVYEFNLKPGSTAVVAGAYKGAVVALLSELYGCTVLGYEPQLWAVERATKALSHLTSPYHIYPYALGVQSGTFPMGEYETDACSFVRLGERWRMHGEGTMREIRDEFTERGLSTVDLFVMNMEGYEFELLPHMYGQNLLRRVRQFAIQFHFGLGNDDSYRDIQRMLGQTHLKVRHGKDWEHWVRHGK